MKEWCQDSVFRHYFMENGPICDRITVGVSLTNTACTVFLFLYALMVITLAFLLIAFFVMRRQTEEKESENV